jgi:hypothetical protein
MQLVGAMLRRLEHAQTAKGLMMSAPATAEEFKDLARHERMWAGFTRFMTRGVVGVVVVVLFVGWITGVL